MEERTAENIDCYLRKEMSDDESVRFEQEALDNHELRKEIELTYLIKKGITDRQRKLYLIKHWERKRRNRAAIAAAIAAMLIGGIFVLQPEQHFLSENTATPASTSGTDNVFERNRQTMQNVKNSIVEKNDNEIIAAIDCLEQNKTIPPLNEMSGNRLFMNYKMTEKETLIPNNQSYELHWRKILSLIKAGKRDKAKISLQRFIRINGKYKHAADSLLQTLN